MKRTTRTNQKSRRGVTLLLTISMIVLFLLMGTAFVVVANDFHKTARRRSSLNSFRVDSTALLDRAFYDALRGPSLDDANSPLRCVDLLGDVYGHGVRGSLLGAGDTGTLGNGLVILDINDSFTSLRVTGPPASLTGDDNYVDGILNGRVITFTTGAAEGYSTRIVSHSVVGGGTLQYVIFDSGSGIDWTQVANGDEYIINGREYSGTGGGSLVGGGGVPNPDAAAMARLQMNSLQPNRIGVPRATLVGNTGYLPTSQSINEPWDAPDQQNMHLSGENGSGDIIPSYHRDILYGSQSPGTNPALIRQLTMRPFFINGNTGSTANEDFDFNFINATTGALNADSLDVDNTNSGRLDSVWIDINLPIQTDNQGRGFRPLVAYRIVDLDGRLNLNACGSDAERLVGSLDRYGSGVGPSDISLSSVVGNYEQFLNARYGADGIPGSTANAISADLKFAHLDPPNYVGGVFSSALPLLSEGSLALSVGLPGVDDFPSHFITPVAAPQIPFDSDFRLVGGVGDDHFRANELESLLRQNDVDSALSGSRLLDDFPMLSNTGISDAVTTHSFEIAIPARTSSILELLRDRIRQPDLAGNDSDVLREIFQEFIDARYISKEMYLGGRFNLNRVFVDAAERTNMARELYILALLTCGENAPAGYPTPPGGGSGDLSYRRSVAQWAVNVVDYLDFDSTMTVFEYDINPFNDPRTAGNQVDGLLTSVAESDRGVVIGVERPELLITETLAVHDRQLENLATEMDVNNDDMNSTGETVANGDSDWDSERLPNSAAYIELYHPWRQTNGTASSEQRLPAELGVNGVNLNRLTPDGNTPVWRIVVHRGPNATDANEAVRSIYFTDPSNSTAPAISGDQFFPTGAVPVISPGDYAVIGSSGNVAGENTFTFGQLTSVMPGVEPEAAEIADTRSIQLAAGQVTINDPTNGIVTRTAKTIVIDESVGSTRERGLSLSDPNGGYTTATAIERESDGFRLTNGANPPVGQPRDTPFDADLGVGAADYHDAEDVEAIWTNGVRAGNYQFRVLRLQRLADPNSNFEENANPYVTVDVANVDLLAFNGLTNNPDNMNMGALVDFRNGPATNAGPTRMGGIERGEDFANSNNQATARRMLFRAAVNRDPFNGNNDEGSTNGDGHNFSYGFIDTDTNQRLETLGARNAAHNDNTVPFGWLAWNNRPYANRMELAHVPFLSAEGLVTHFGDAESITSPTLGAEPDADDAFSFFFGDDDFGHLFGFGSVVRGGGTNPVPNRFDNLLDFVEVPNRFLGSETFLSNDVSASGPLLVNLTDANRFVPNFRYPGLVNINTIDSAIVWNAVTRGFGTVNFNAFRTNRSDPDGPTDLGGLYTTAQGGEFVETGASADRLRKGAAANLFRRDGTDYELDSTDDTSVGGGTNTENIATFRNELRTRLGGLTTTRSSVYAFWITIGYFEVDQEGRVGREIGSDQGQVRRDRAFYMVDRSIPVAYEPGKNHNVDDAVLVRTIIE